jgi:uncharacterized protein RhaS with RHS repeats
VESTISYTYDAADRLTEVVDSLAGTIDRTYDDFDRLTNETTPMGSVSYTHDLDGRRTSMSISRHRHRQHGGRGPAAADVERQVVER